MKEKRAFAIVVSLVLLSAFILGCSNQEASTGDNADEDLEEGISEVDSAKEDFNQEEVDSGVNALEGDFSDW